MYGRFEHAYELMMEADAAGAMSSGHELDSSMSNPKHGIYGVWHPLSKTKKFFKTKIDRRKFLEAAENSEWEAAAE